MNKVIILSLLFLPLMLLAQDEDTLEIQGIEEIEEQETPQPSIVSPITPVENKRAKPSFDMISRSRIQMNAPKIFKIDTKTKDFKKAEKKLKNIDKLKLKDYSAKAIRTVDNFGNYLSLIANKDTHKDDKIDLIGLVLSLFINENMVVCDNTLLSYQKQINCYYIEDFLNKIQEINYEEIEWTIISSIKNFNLESTQEEIEVMEIVRSPKLTSQKTVQVYFTFQNKFLYDKSKKMYQIKLGNITCD